MARLTATEVARSFSEILNRVQAGEEIEVTRNGAPVAVIGPAAKKRTWVPMSEVKAYFGTLQPFDDDFAKDVEEARRRGGIFGDLEDPWEKY